MMIRAALLIIDMQNDFILEGAPLRVKDVEKITGSVRLTLEVFRNHRLSIFLAQGIPERWIRCRDIPA
jgi:nicotinamidase-related amidase